MSVDVTWRSRSQHYILRRVGVRSGNKEPRGAASSFQFIRNVTGQWRRYARADLDRRIPVARLADPARKLPRGLHTIWNGRSLTDKRPTSGGATSSLFCLPKTSVADSARNILRARREGVAGRPRFGVRIFVGLPCAAADDGSVDAVQITDHLGVRTQLGGLPV